MENNSLQHYGVLGMRWGVRRYQNADGSLTSAGKRKAKQLAKEEAKETKAATKATKTAAEEQARKDKAAADEKAKKDAYEAAKKKAIDSGTAGEILKYKGELTNTELQAAVTRLNFEKRLSELKAADEKSVKTKLDQVEEVMGKVNRLNDVTKKGIDAWNTIAKINNSISDTKLVVIDGNKKKDKKD